MNIDKFELIWKVTCKTLLYFQDNLLALAAFILSVISLYITWRKNIKDRQYTNDKELIEQLKQSLELAFKSLAPSHNGGQPTNSKLRWLAAARHIARYRELQLSLKTSLYKTICEEHEEYWSDEVYNLLARIDNSSFFECINTEKKENEKINMKSAAVVYSFSVWKEGRPDPLANMSLEEIILEYKLFSPLHKHFWDYVKRETPNLAEKVRCINSKKRVKRNGK